MTESELEHLALKWFQDTGWDYRAGLDIAPDSDAPERRDYRQVLLQSELRAALTLLNHQTPTAVLDEVAHQLAKPEHPSLIQSNRAFHEALVSGVSVEVEIAGERRGDRVQLVDFENPERNHFLVVSQFTVQGGKQLRRADLVCFINGLPLAVIEPKNPAAAQGCISPVADLQGGDERPLCIQRSTGGGDRPQRPRRPVVPDFVGARSLLRELPQQAGNREELRTLLAGRPSGGIIFTTVQKFTPDAGEEVFPLLSDRHNIVVIADEAHRSQYGFSAVLDKKTGRYKYGFAKHLRDALKNATFVGFTGTPIEGADHDTRAVFGDYVSIYDIQDAVDDGATVPIFYESRLAKLNLNQSAMEQMNAEVEEVFEDEEDAALKEATKTRWAALEKLVGAEARRRA